jgi:3-hydroxyisobutyrate dehydrogenase
MIAILGTGLLGSGFTRALRRKGETVHVWNRTAERATALAADGAIPFADPAEAVRGASRVHLTLSDDAAVDAVLERLPAGLLVIDHTTTSTAGALARSARTDLTYCHAPVFMGPQNALESTGLMLLSGDRALVARVTPLVASMTGKVLDLGERVDAAAAFKLMGNLFLMAFTAGLADFLGLARALGVDFAQAASLFEHFKPGSTIAPRLSRMIGESFQPPSWELAMARKDARLIQQEVAGKLALTLLPTIAAKMDEMVERGHAHDDWTIIAKDFVSP